MPTKTCEVCCIQVVNLNRHLKSKKHLRFQKLAEYGNYSDEEMKTHNNILAKQLKDKTLLGYLYAFFAYILYIMSFQRIKR